MWDILVTIVGVLAIVLIWIMLYDSNRFIVVQHVICDARIRKPFRAVVLSDLHDKQFGKGNRQLLESIRAQKPDLILVAGDMVTAERGMKLDKAVDFMKQLAAEFPVYYANGNHEYRMKLYPEVYGDLAEQYEKALQEMGLERLVNKRVDLETYGVSIYGSEIDRVYYQRFRKAFMEENYLEQLLGKAEQERYRILLAHNPDYFPEYAHWGADLVLSGHVHGGMVRIPGWKGVVSPAVRLFPKYDGGVFREGNSTMILGRGLGMHTIPIRLFNPGELIVLDLKNEAAESVTEVKTKRQKKQK